MSFGYRDARAATATPWLDAGTEVRCHEFHYSSIRAAGAPAWELSAGGLTRPDGVVAGSVQGTYLHVHWAAYPEIAARFVRAAAA
jgi:cobyrinic acid a,c-diamide synthase